MAARFILIALALSLGSGSEAVAQAGKPKSPPAVPTVSQRMFSAGTAKLVVTGAFQVSADVPINAKASFSDGEKTWIQFGASGAKEPNVLVTYGDGDTGIIVGSGSWTATAEGQHCSGQADVTATSVAGKYTCKGVTAFDKKSMKMSPIEITLTFTSKT
jgi:hypothetical protein